MSSRQSNSRRASRPAAVSSRTAQRAASGALSGDSATRQRRRARGRGDARDDASAASGAEDRKAPSRRRGGADRSAAGTGSQEGSAYSRRVSQAEYSRLRKRKKRRKVALVAVAVVAALCLGGAGVAFAYYATISDNLHEGIDDSLRGVLADTQYASDPFYMLLMGTDGSSEREASEEYAGDTFRSDSMMLARIDPKNKKVTLVSLHRDTLIDMGEYGQQKLNAAHAFGGASYAVEVVSEFAGVPISHYAEINFDGFRDIVDALGGVEVDVPMEIDDEDAGGHLDAGLQTLNGDQALILCRARHAYDDYGDGDSYRAANQRLVLAAIAEKILGSDIVTITNTVTALSEHVTTDFEITDIVGLAQLMKGLDPSTDIYSAMEPTTSAYVNGGWYEYTDESAWREMMERVDQGLPPTEEDIVDATGTVLASTGSGSTGGGSSGSASDSSASDGGTASRTGTVAVRNGNGIAGGASEAGGIISALGYTVETGNASSFDYDETLVVYESSGQRQAAEEIVDALGVGRAVLNDGSYANPGDFLVVLGADYE